MKIVHKVQVKRKQIQTEKKTQTALLSYHTKTIASVEWPPNGGLTADDHNFHGPFDRTTATMASSVATRD